MSCASEQYLSNQHIILTGLCRNTLGTWFRNCADCSTTSAGSQELVVASLSSSSKHELWIFMNVTGISSGCSVSQRSKQSRKSHFLVCGKQNKFLNLMYFKVCIVDCFPPSLLSLTLFSLWLNVFYSGGDEIWLSMAVTGVKSDCIHVSVTGVKSVCYCYRDNSDCVWLLLLHRQLGLCPGLPICYLLRGYLHPLLDFLEGVFTPASSA